MCLSNLVFSVLTVSNGTSFFRPDYVWPRENKSVRNLQYGLRTWLFTHLLALDPCNSKITPLQSSLFDFVIDI